MFDEFVKMFKPVAMFWFENLPEELLGEIDLVFRQLARQFFVKELIVDFNTQIISQLLGLPLKFLATTSHLALQRPRFDEGNKDAPFSSLSEMMDSCGLLDLVFAPSRCSG